MTLTAEQKEYADELGFTEAEYDDFERLFSSERIGKLKAGYAKNKDYTTKTQALADERKRIEALQAENETEKTRLAEWKQGAEAQLATALEKVEKSNLRGAALQSRLEKLALEYNLDADELMKGVLEARADDTNRTDKDRKQAEVDLSGYIKKEDFHSQMSAVGMLPVITRDLEREYRTLFGKEYDGSLEELVTEGFKEIATRQQKGENVNFKDYIREKLDFSGQRKRNDEAEREKWKEDTRKEIEMDVRSKLGAEDPGRFQRAEADESPFLRKKERTPDANTKGPAGDHARRQGIYAAFEKERQKHANA